MEKTSETKEEEEKDYGISIIDFTDESGIEWFGDEVWKSDILHFKNLQKEILSALN